MKRMTPFRLRRWQVGPPATRFYSYFFTCGRPGYTGNPANKHAQVPDEMVHRWVLGLPRPNTVIVSLLGREPDGLSEYSYYSFYGGFDSPSEHPGCLSLQEWLDRWHTKLSIWERQHPTQKLKPIDPVIMDVIASDIDELLSCGRTVVLVDSDGNERTRKVCSFMHAEEVQKTVRGHDIVHSANFSARSAEMDLLPVLGPNHNMSSSVKARVAEGGSSSPGLWESGNPAFYAGFPSAVGTVENSALGVFHGFHGASFPQPGAAAIFAANSSGV